MATANEILAIIIKADGQGAVREITRVGNTARAQLSTVTTQSERVQLSLIKTGAAATVFGVVAGKQFLNAGVAAAELSQRVRATQAVFGETADKIDSFAEASAKS